MSIHVCMLTGLLIGAPPADAPPAPKLEKGLEITWRGTFSEAVLRPNVRAFRTYEVETRVFVWDVSDKGADVALFTSIKLKPDVKTTPEPAAIVRLQLARIGSNGATALLGAEALDEAADKRKPAPLPPLALEGLPTLEAGLFVAFPAGKMRAGLAWDAAEEQRPPLVCRVEGLDSVRGSRCWKVAAAQQTEDWDRPRSGKTAWRRGETTWVSGSHGCALRLERTVEKNDPQTGDLGFRSKLAYEQVGRMSYPGRFGEDRKEEAAAAARFAAEFQRLAAVAGRDGTTPFDDLLRRIEQHVASHVAAEAVPYRAAILAVKWKAEAAKRGHIPPAPPPPESVVEVPALVAGKPAADFIAKDLINSTPLRLSKLRSKPVVLLYYQPSSAKTAEPVLRLAQDLYAQHGDKAHILPLAIGNSEAAVQQHHDLKLTVPILAGRDVYKLHGVDSTPYFAVIGADGVVKKVTLGWSEDNVGEVRAELDKWLKQVGSR